MFHLKNCNDVKWHFGNMKISVYFLFMNNIEGNNRVLQLYIIVHIYYTKYTMAEKKHVYTILDDDTMNPGLKHVSICSQQENCQISLKIVSIRSQISS